MKYKHILILFLFSANFLFSQLEVSPDHFVIQFTDKNSNDFNIENPELFLSAKSIERRCKGNIPITKEDLPISKIYIDSIKNTGVKILAKSKWLNSVVINTDDPLKLKKIVEFPFVKIFSVNIDNNYDEKYYLDCSDNYQFYNKTTTNCHKNFSYSSDIFTMLNAYKLPEWGFCGKNIDIAIMDAGFQGIDTSVYFENVINKGRVKYSYDYRKQNENVYNNGINHGSLVFSLIAADNDGYFVGTATEANFYLFNTEVEGSEYLIEEFYFIDAIEKADSIGVDITQTSLGYNLFDDASQNYKKEELDGKTAPTSFACSIAVRKGIIPVVSAGNEGSNSWHYITAPADAINSVAVGSVNKNEKISYFSSEGFYPFVDGKAKPSVVAQGSQVKALEIDGNIASIKGTSFSAPQIAGLLASIWQAFPKATNLQIIDALEKSADKYNNPDEKYGYGLPNFHLMFSILSNKNMQKITNDFSFAINPNPFSENIKISVFSIKNENIKIEIFDIHARKIFNYTEFFDSVYKEFHFNELDFIKSGMYFVRVSVNNEFQTVKMLKN